MFDPYRHKDKRRAENYYSQHSKKIRQLERNYRLKRKKAEENVIYLYVVSQMKFYPEDARKSYYVDPEKKEGLVFNAEANAPIHASDLRPKTWLIKNKTIVVDAYIVDEPLSSTPSQNMASKSATIAKIVSSARKYEEMLSDVTTALSDVEGAPRYTCETLGVYSPSFMAIDGIEKKWHEMKWGISNKDARFGKTVTVEHWIPLFDISLVDEAKEAYSERINFIIEVMSGFRLNSYKIPRNHHKHRQEIKNKLKDASKLFNSGGAIEDFDDGGVPHW